MIYKTYQKKEQKNLTKELLQLAIYSMHQAVFFWADLNSNYCFPVNITSTQLRTGIAIFSNSLRKVILIELLCHCEENMESLHSTKTKKNLALKTII